MDSEARILAKFYRSVIDHMRSGVCVYRPVRDPVTDQIVDFEWVLANAYATRKTGHSESYFIGRRLLEVFPSHGDQVMELFRRVFETGRSDDLTVEYDTSTPPLDGVFNISAAKFADGLLVAFVDVTEETRRRAEAETVSNRLSVATRAAGIGIWEVDLEAEKAWWDDTTRHIHAVPDDEELSLRHWRDVVHPDDLARIDGFTGRAIARGAEDTQVFGERYRIRRPNGSVRHVQSHARLMESEGVKKLVGAAWDVTDEVVAAEELDIKRREAEGANVAKSQFLAVMSHEIRTPLNAMLGMAAVLEQTQLSDTQRDMLHSISEAGDELLEILNSMLELSRIEAGLLELEEAPFDINALLRRATVLFRPRASEKGVVLTLERGRNLYGALLGDPKRIRQILYNLLSNAVKFTPSGEIVVSADLVKRPSDGGRSHEFVLSVRDTGIGIPEDKLEAIFRPFVQADGTTTRIFGGTGLGLSIAREFARLMNGSITVESKVGVGSTFVVRIPMDRAEAGVEAPVAAVSGAPKAEAQNRHLTILAAEDNAVNQAVLRALLSEPAVTLTVVENGLEAIKAWAASRYDLVLLDMQMPVMDGPSAAREIRRLETETKRERTPIIAISANALPHHVEMCLSAGMDLHVSKPLNPEELLGAIRRLTDQRQGGEEAVA